jgi:3-methyladenine DNA glycosylase AlkC
MSTAPKLKSFFSPALVRRLAQDIAAVHPAFPTRAFVRDATTGLDALELVDRGRHIARALTRHLPPSYPDALVVLLRSLGAEHATDELVGAGMAPFYYLPHAVFIAERGLGHFDLSMRGQVEITKRFSAEFSIRPYIAADPERAFEYLSSWSTNANAHVRRLVSEGTRLRLPWAQRVPWLDAHPERILALLDTLKDDPSGMVRRSVANNLNDIGKTRPELLIRTADAWLRRASPARQALVEHALRGAVKRGTAEALYLLGYGARAAVAIDAVRFEPARVPIGGRVVLTFVLRSTAGTAQHLLIDVAVHFVKARGHATAKVFKLTRLTLAPRERRALRTSFSLKVHTTRVPRPGRHEVDILVNGTPHRAGAFTVLRGRSPAIT